MDVLNVTEAELYVLIILAQLEPFSFRLGQKIGSSMELCVTLNAVTRLFQKGQTRHYPFTITFQRLLSKV